MIHLPHILLEIPRNVVTAVGLPISLGFLSSLPNRKMIKGQWYKSLYKPRFSPPGITFPIVWPILYAAMGYASHLAVNALDTAVTTTGKEDASLAMTLYYVQLALNYSWLPVFLFVKKPVVALAHAVTLAGVTFYMTDLLHNITDGATTPFLAPYCAWMSFAVYLSGSIWWNTGAKDTSKKN